MTTLLKLFAIRSYPRMFPAVSRYFVLLCYYRLCCFVQHVLLRTRPHFIYRYIKKTYFLSFVTCSKLFLCSEVIMVDSYTE